MFWALKRTVSKSAWVPVIENSLRIEKGNLHLPYLLPWSTVPWTTPLGRICKRYPFRQNILHCAEVVGSLVILRTRFKKLSPKDCGQFCFFKRKGLILSFLVARKVVLDALSSLDLTFVLLSAFVAVMTSVKRQNQWRVKKIWLAFMAYSLTRKKQLNR